ncbi:hypothetical protein MRS44_007614 [Fusarium solani]|uniref:uncharacterized protein n=1 Tax=Fusarium solani TaxID=169388 RepID=UPI0032C4A614|nr:hypothetical protein MRS44_007614 [Fusarium solani]
MVKKTGPSRKAAPSKQSNKKSAAPAQNQEASSPPPLQSQDEQQRLLDVFSNAFKSTLTSDDFAGLLQEVKQALFNRDFATAFGREDYLEAYAARWSPTRTLCYNTVFLGINEHLDGILASEEGSSGGKNLESSTQAGLAKDSGALEQDTKPGEASAETGPDAPKPERSQTRSTLRMLSIGGCAAEHLAFASYLQSTSSNGHLTLLDSAPWASVISSLESSTNSPPPISKYASATARAANRALLEPGQLSVEVVQQDVLALDVDSLTARCAGGKVPIVVTLLFTLNELYTSGGIGKTTKFLKNLGQALAPGSLVLVVDSPGSYSEAALGKEKKRYPMQWLLDHTLLETETPGYSWEKLQSDDSIWFRLPEGLSYPIPLENMRYQIHLYRLEKSS